MKNPKNKPIVLREAQIQATCTAFLELDGWRHLRTDPVSDRIRGKGFGEEGMADDLYLRYGKMFLYSEAAPLRLPARLSDSIMFIEWKRIDPKGKTTKLTLKQFSWHQLERKRGALTVRAGLDFEATIEGFYNWYKNSGLMIKSILMPSAG